METNTRVITTTPQVIFEYDEDRNYEVVYEAGDQQILFFQECDLTQEQINKLIITIQLPDGEQTELTVETDPDLVLEEEDYCVIGPIVVTKKENLNVDGIPLEKRGIYFTNSPSFPITVSKIVLNETSNMPFVAQVQEMIELIKSASMGPEWDYLPDQAESPQILQGYSAYNERKKTIVGTMIDNGAITARLTGDLPTYTVPAGYHNGEGVVKIEVEEKTITPSTSQTVVTPSEGKLLSKVTVKSLSNLLQSKNVTITEVPQTITPDSDYSGLAQVVVEALGSEYVKVQKQTSSSNVSVGSNSATATLDFVPDIFILTNSSYTASYSFTEKNNNTLTVYVSSSLSYKCVRNSNTITISRSTGSGSQSFSYIAIKYTN